MKNEIMKYFLSLITLLCFSIGGFGQVAQTYYYYQGNKVFLELDLTTISISIEGESTKDLFKSTQSNTNVKMLDIVEDYTRSYVNAIDKKAVQKKKVRTYYTEIESNQIKSQSEYQKQLAGYNQMENVLLASPAFLTSEGKKLGLSNNFYVKLKSKEDVRILYEKAEKMKVEILGHDKYMPLWFTLSVSKKNSSNALKFANIFHETGLFAHAEPAFMYHNLQASNDTYFSNQWSLKNTGQNGGTSGIDINAEQAWGISQGGANIKTAVFDHGFEMNHPDLQANVYGTGFDATTGTSPSQVRGNHGTPCSGIIGAVKDNNLGISGVAPGSKLMSVSIRLLLSDTPQQLASGFNWAWQNGADVISNSWGGYAPSNIITDAITNALNNGRGGKGTVIVFAAGNENNTNIRYPGNSIPRILVIGAMSPCGERKNPSSCDGESWGSCYGSQLDVVAPGVKMPATDRQGSNGYSSTDYTQTFNGTSSACPVVAGVAALVLSVNPGLTVNQVNDIIEKSAQKVRTDLYNYQNHGGRPNGTWNNQMGYGLVDAYQAVLMAQNSGCPPYLTITQNVPGGTTSNKQASNTITASNKIFNNATANYKAGNRVRFVPGFKAYSGSKFRAHIGSCSSFAPLATTEEEIVYDFIENDTKNSASSLVIDDSNLDIYVYPNPVVGGKLFIKSSQVTQSVALYSITGKRVFHKRNVNQINVSDLSPGFYLLKINLAGQQVSKKVIIE